MAWDDFSFDSAPSDYGSINPSDYSLTNYASDSAPGMSWTDYSGNAPLSQYYQLGGPGGQFDTSLGGGGNIYQGPGTQGPGGLGIPGLQADVPYTPAVSYPADPMATGQPGGWGTGDPSGINPTAPGVTSVGGGAGAGSGGGGLFGGVGAGGGLGTPGLLGLLGGGAGLIGSLLAGGKTGSSTPIMSTPMRAAGNQSYDALQGLTQFAQGQSPLQQQQTALLNALANGQATPGLQQLIQQAYGPAWQSVAQQSIEGGRNAGFYDNPMSSPVGGAIMGPAAAQLQGQEANSLLNAMYQVPGMFQAPINAQIGAQGSQATGFSNLMGQYPYGTQQSQPLGSQVGQGVAGTLLGLGQGMTQNANQVAQQSWQNQMLQQQQQQNADFRKMMAQSVMNQGPIQTGMSGQTQQQPYGGYDFSQTYGTGGRD